MCIAKRRRQREQKKTTIDLVIAQKKTTTILDVQHPFLYISLPLFCTTTTRNFLVRRFMEKMLHVSVCLFVCFFTLAHFQLGGH